MSSIIQHKDTFHGISVLGHGVFTGDELGDTYAGQIRGGKACGPGVLTFSSGSKAYVEHGPDGQYDGRYMYHTSYGTTVFALFEREEVTEFAEVSWDDGTCDYNGEGWGPHDPRVLPLMAKVRPVEVRPTARAPPPATRRPLATKQSSE